MRNTDLGEMLVALKAARKSGILGGPHYASAKGLPRWRLTARANLGVIDHGTTAVGAAAAGFWTELAIRGAIVDSNFSAGVEKLIVSQATGAVLQGIVGPTAVGAETHTIRVVMDGISWSTGPITMAATYGLVLGYITGAGLFGTTATTDFLWSPSASALDLTTGFRTTDNAYNMAGPGLEIVGTPMAMCLQSMQIYITSSVNITGTAAMERQSGATFRVL